MFWGKKNGWYWISQVLLVYRLRIQLRRSEWNDLHNNASERCPLHGSLRRENVRDLHASHRLARNSGGTTLRVLIHNWSFLYIEISFLIYRSVQQMQQHSPPLHLPLWNQSALYMSIKHLPGLVSCIVNPEKYPTVRARFSAVTTIVLKWSHSAIP